MSWHSTPLQTHTIIVKIQINENSRTTVAKKMTERGHEN